MVHTGGVVADRETPAAGWGVPGHRGRKVGLTEA